MPTRYCFERMKKELEKNTFNLPKAEDHTSLFRGWKFVACVNGVIFDTLLYVLGISTKLTDVYVQRSGMLLAETHYLLLAETTCFRSMSIAAKLWKKAKPGKEDIDTICPQSMFANDSVRKEVFLSKNAVFTQGGPFLKCSHWKKKKNRKQILKTLFLESLVVFMFFSNLTAGLKHIIEIV